MRKREREYTNKYAGNNESLFFFFFVYLANNYNKKQQFVLIFPKKEYKEIGKQIEKGKERKIKKRKKK